MANHRQIAILGLFIVGTLATIAANNCQAQEVAPVMIGVKECAACHSNPSPIYQQLGVTKFVQLTEASQWLQKDKHSHAYKLIDPATNPRTREMLVRLEIEPNSELFQTSCLTCHAGAALNQPLMTASELTWGVQCESCHGAGSVWTLRENHQQPQWRTKTPEEKSALGFADLHSPEVRAENCYSCHIGDISQSRFVTHAMYAAGHPPLPAIEIETFVQTMGRHWKTLSEKEDFLYRQEYVAAHGGLSESPSGDSDASSKNRDITTESIQSSLIGATVASKVSLELLLEGAAQPELATDFALFDCAACHHELRTPSYRQLARMGSRPGRPRPLAWALAAGYLGSDDSVSYRQALLDVQQIFDAKPFGDPNKITATDSPVRSAITMLESRVAQLKKTPVQRSQIASVLKQVGGFSASDLADFQTSRQLGWLLWNVANREGLAEQEFSELNQLRQALALELPTEQDLSVIDYTAKSLEQSARYAPDQAAVQLKQASDRVLEQLKE